MKLFVCVLFFLLVPLTAAASISGTTYDFTLKPVATTVEINSTPAQTYVAGDGHYSLEVSTGVYVVSVSEIGSEGLELKETQEILVSDDGAYTLDFIIFPDLDEVDDPEFEFEEVTGGENEWFTAPLFLMGALLLLLLIILMRSHHAKLEPDVDDQLEKRVLAIIKAHRRISQKELRKRLPESESAVSLVITDLERKKRIEKIKKGRANIIVFKK